MCGPADLQCPRIVKRCARRTSNLAITPAQSWKRWACKRDKAEPSTAHNRPGDLWELDLSNACTYYFREADVGVDLGSTNALAILQADGCRHVTRQWVDNHYSQILWKLAGLCRAQPSLFSIRWNWTEVIDQLKYRYEREIGRAERPIVRRIQEHDSSGAVPMVLVVSAIRWVATDAAVGPGGKGGREANGSQAARGGVTGSQHDGRSAGMMPFLELTDGWYRIYAEVDPCLTRAVEKGRITVGQKLAICGAKACTGSTWLEDGRLMAARLRQ